MFTKALYTKGSTGNNLKCSSDWKFYEIMQNYAQLKIMLYENNEPYLNIFKYKSKD